MMVTTHAIAGLLLALPVAVAAPDHASAAFLAGVVGGGFPDLDLYAGHRKTLHFPVYYSLAAVPAFGLAAFVPGPVTVGAAVGLAAAAAHSLADIAGGGLELRPWRGTSDRAVYNHAAGRWIPPRRWVRYDGAPEDLGIAVLIGMPLLVVDVGGGALRTTLAGLLAVSALYAGVRKPLAAVPARVAVRLPPPVRGRLPPRYRDV